MRKWKLSPPIQLTMGFMLFGIAWIITTDFLSLILAKNDLLNLSKLQTYKGLLFMCLGAVFIYFISSRLFEKQHRLEKELSNERLRSRNELALNVFNAQEAERKKIGAELHDNITQILGVVKLYVDNSLSNPQVKEEMLRKSSDLLLQAINEIRELSASLAHPTLKDVGLIASIQQQIENIEQIEPIDISLDVHQFNETELSDNKKLMLYRIVQEQLNNIIKHANAAHVAIVLKHKKPAVTLTIEDDGVGFDTNMIGAGIGLKNIRNRLELYNGEMNILSSPGNGCKIEAIFKA